MTYEQLKRLLPSLEITADGKIRISQKDIERANRYVQEKGSREEFKTNNFN